MIAFLVLAAFAAAQQVNLPTQLPPDLDELSKRVDAAHHPKGPIAPVTAFEGELELQLLAVGDVQGGQVDLAVRYLQWQRPDDTVRHLIRRSSAAATATASGTSCKGKRAT